MPLHNLIFFGSISWVCSFLEKWIVMMIWKLMIMGWSAMKWTAKEVLIVMEFGVRFWNEEFAGSQLILHQILLASLPQLCLSLVLAEESYEATVGNSTEPIPMTMESFSAIVNNASPRALVVTPLLAILTLLRHALQKRTEENTLNRYISKGAYGGTIICGCFLFLAYMNGYTEAYQNLLSVCFFCAQLKASTHFGVFAVVLDCVSVFLAPAIVITFDLLIHKNESLSIPISLPFPLCPAMVYNFAAIVAVGTLFLIRKGLLFEVRFVHNEQVPPAIPFFHPNRA
ncbi:hypothetical protein B9Z55_020623 [Caenorhabditis nigoni]|uniref:Uncharacterized protein n=1 Tax=Caenorhabditis nigoni TaxID=1611254 RepID=A0A2G5TPB7_9PELO|nr:hypothetical protein B9Z55_020623 [Caenorhabditis nigoni]